jgi:hypothetical protein
MLLLNKKKQFKTELFLFKLGTVKADRIFYI